MTLSLCGAGENVRRAPWSRQIQYEQHKAILLVLEMMTELRKHMLRLQEMVAEMLAALVPQRKRERRLQELLERLTPSEQVVLRLVADGYVAKEIAYRLGVSEETVRSHMRGIRNKLDVSDRVHLRTWLYRELQSC
jgi:DNA-binding NarL/FixJ family response regulator